MKVRITMKTPDAVEDAAEEAFPIDFDDQQFEEDAALYEQDSFRSLCEKWFRYGEHVTLEVDTEEGTITVVEAE